MARPHAFVKRAFNHNIGGSVTTACPAILDAMTMTDPDLVRYAALNNAEWCDCVCAAHGVPGRFLDGMWVNPNRVPQYYPNAVTLEPSNHTGDIIAIIADAVGSKQAAWSVKDSFRDLDFSATGLVELFDAEWIVAPDVPRAEGLDDVQWSTLGTPADLSDWEAAWSDGGPMEIFKPSLLSNREIRFIAGRCDGKIVAGAVASRSRAVAGMSNVFTPPVDAPYYWSACVAAVRAAFPGLLVVDYERGKNLALAKEVGFRSIGPLRVWTTPAEK
jgi:hypothetical protein